MKSKVLIIIPAYNEEKNIKKTINSLNDLNVDYIVINDGSSDNTLNILNEINANYINLPFNMGIGCAVQTGYKYAKLKNYDIAIQYDGDGQHNSKYIPKLINKINSGYDMVIGSRYLEKKGFQSSFMRRIGIKWMRMIIKILNGNTTSDPTSGFRACNKKLIDYFANNYPYDYPEPETYLISSLLGYKIADIPVVMNERSEGKSSIRSLKSIYFMIKVTISLIFDRIIYGRSK